VTRSAKAFAPADVSSLLALGWVEIEFAECPSGCPVVEREIEPPFEVKRDPGLSERRERDGGSQHTVAQRADHQSSGVRLGALTMQMQPTLAFQSGGDKLWGKAF
jgi:hypothetical protein